MSRRKYAINTNTRVVFINTPGNPTGAIISRETLRALASYCFEPRYLASV